MTGAFLAEFCNDDGLQMMITIPGVAVAVARSLVHRSFVARCVRRIWYSLPSAPIGPPSVWDLAVTIDGSAVWESSVLFAIVHMPFSAFLFGTWTASSKYNFS